MPAVAYSRAALRDKETELTAARAAREMDWTEAAAGHPSLAREFGRAQAELTRLRAILREHDIDPGDAPAHP